MNSTAVSDWAQPAADALIMAMVKISANLMRNSPPGTSVGFVRIVSAILEANGRQVKRIELPRVGSQTKSSRLWCDEGS